MTSRQMAHNIMATKPPPPVIVGVRLKKTSVEVVRAACEPLGGGKKAKLTVISRKSIINAVEVLTNAEPELQSMIVATYPDTFPDDGRIVKAHHKALNEAIRRKLGDFSYFTAVEYQKRGAPHYHQGTSFDLSAYGPVVTLRRKKMSRRKPTFQTVKELQDWAFEIWLDIISKPDIAYNGEPLEWAGVDEDDQEMMRKAYYHYHSGFSWEVMREKDGAKRYFVKELTGLKLHQKTVPPDFKNPGRHFLYSKDMGFDLANALDFVIDGDSLRELLQLSGWKYVPKEGKPLFKFLWNAAANLAVTLIEAGYEPIKSGLKALKEYTDQRVVAFADMTDELTQRAAGAGIFGYAKSVADYWQGVKQGYERQQYWARVFATGPP